MSVIVETERLRLREMVPGDLDFVATMLANPDVSRYYERRFDRADAQAWLERQLARYARDGHGLWLVETGDTSEPIGQVGIAMQEVEGERHPEIGWLLHRPFWGRGYATEAGSAARDLAFARWRYPYVISLIRPINLASRRVAERLGLQPGREVRFHGFTHLVYSLDAPRTPQHSPEAGSWKLEAGSRKLEAGSRKPEAGSWKLEAGSRKPEAGSRSMCHRVHEHVDSERVAID